jgi:hypothetical protein
MIKLIAILLAASGIAFATSGPAAAVTDLWALDDKGEPARLKGFAKVERVYSVEEHKALNEGLKKKYSQKKVFCNQEFMLSTGQVRWIVTHTKSKHRIVLRERLPKGQHRNVC